jgi:hypothetical protein
MNDSMILTLVSDGMWLLVAVGWVLLLGIGLEADKPLSGGIPGHVDAHEGTTHTEEGWADRLGELGAWVTFGLVVAALPVVLWWILL